MGASDVGDSVSGGAGRRLRVLEEGGGPLSLSDRPSQMSASRWRSLATETKLPVPLTRFVGREAELVQAAGLLAAARLLTLTGPGGCGKTRLALRLATEQGERFPDGAWFVDLASLTDGEYVLAEVAMTIGVEEPERRLTLQEALGRFLSARHALVVLDNCEHVVQSAAAVAARLLDAAPTLTLLATSREPLGVAGEVTWAVPALIETDAIALFEDRARLARPEFALRRSEVDAVQAICERLDGLPLAIELAAARVRSLAPARIASHLSDHFSVLATGPRTAPRRQATLRASFEWSYELLSDRERALLRQLAVFAGSFDIDAALAVCPTAAIEVIASLVDRSLLMVDDKSDANIRRYRMLETIRQFAGERLETAVEEAAGVRTRHCSHYLGLAETAAPKLTGGEQEIWLSRLAAEQDNLRAAMAWARDHGHSEVLVRLVLALTAFWLERSQWTECRTWLDAAEAHAGSLSALLRARVLNRRSYLETWAGALEMVPALGTEALALARAAGDKKEEAWALASMGVIAGMVIGADAARPYIEEAVGLARSVGFKWGVAVCLGFFSLFRWLQADPEEPVRLVEEAMAEARAIGDRRSLRIAMVIAGLTDVTQGRLTDAEHKLSDSLAAGYDAAHPFPVIGSLLGLAWIRLVRGDLEGAVSAASESAALSKETEESRIFQGLAMGILGSAQMAGGEADRGRATLEDAVEVTRTSEAPRFEAVPLAALAEAQLSLDNFDEARRSLNRAKSIAGAAAFTWVLGRLGLVEAKLDARQHDPVAAESAIHDAVTSQMEAGDRVGLVDGLEIWAGLAAAQASPKEAVRLWAAADSLRGDLGYARRPVDRTPHDEAIAVVRNLLGADDFALAWGEGAQLTPDEAIAYAARGRGERRRPVAGWQSLTPSELDVVRLVGQHLTNPEIASRLFVSRATVKTHLIHVFAKLGVTSRSQLAAEAIRRRIEGRSDPRSDATRTGESSARSDQSLS
jgi:predicted ATPase/DNA-binding CsgD family transcriptional regulator